MISRALSTRRLNRPTTNFDANCGDEPSYAAAFLGVFAVFAMWVFPEVTKKNPASLK